MLRLADLADRGGAEASRILAVLMLRFWPTINKYAAKSTTVASWDEVHDWVLDSIRYVASKRAWEQAGNTLVKNKRWADSAVHTRLKCTRINAYQASNRDKRIADYTSNSWEAMQEEFGDSFHSSLVEEEVDKSADYAYHLFTKYVERQEYFTALIVDAIVNHDVLEEDEKGSGLSVKKLKKHLTALDDKFWTWLKSEYNLPAERVKRIREVVESLSPKQIENNIQKTVQQLYYQLWMARGKRG